MLLEFKLLLKEQAHICPEGCNGGHSSWDLQTGTNRGKKKEGPNVTNHGYNRAKNG